MGQRDLNAIEQKIEDSKQKEKKARKAKRKKDRKSFFAEFKKFITRGNVVDMAIGVAVASAFTAIVTAFTKGFVSPIIALFSNSASLDEFKWVIREEILDADQKVVQSEVAILWGGFLQAIINFLIIAFTFFVILKIVSSVKKRANRLMEEIKKFADEEAAKEKAEAEAKAKAEADAKAAAEKAAAEAKDAEEKRYRNAMYEQNQLLKEIKDLLQSK